MIEIIDDEEGNSSQVLNLNENEKENDEVFCIICENSDDLLVEIRGLSKALKFCLELITDFCISEASYEKFLCSKCNDEVNQVYLFRLKCFKSNYVRDRQKRKLNESSSRQILNLDDPEYDSDALIKVEPENQTDLDQSGEQENVNITVLSPNQINPNEILTEVTVTDSSRPILSDNVNEIIEYVDDGLMFQSVDNNKIEETYENYDSNTDEFTVVVTEGADEIEVSNQNIILQQTDCYEKRLRKSTAKITSEFHNTHKCPVCSKSFNSVESFKRHHYRMHRMVKKSYLCPFLNCHEIFTCGYKLNVHLRKHGNTECFTCDLCQKSFYDKAYLVEHMKALHMTNLASVYKCDQCGKQFNVKSRLRMHKRIHSDEARKHICENCNKGFITKEKLQRHSVVHSGIRAFICKSCNISYKNSYSLKVHQKKCNL